MENSPIIKGDSFLNALTRLVAFLRGKDGCPWDKKQTPDSVSVYVIEEVYELAEAIEKGASEEIREELGDVLFHIVFIAQMFQEAGLFDLEAVAEGITRKMIRRHPHVFGDRTVDGTEEVIQNWHQIKLSERQAAHKDSIFGSVPGNLPALMRAYRILDRAAKSGIEIKEMPGAVCRPDNPSETMETACSRRDNDLQSEDFGQLLLMLVDKCRKAGVHPETALAATVKQFEHRVKQVQDLIAERRQNLKDLSPEQKAEIWHKIKNHS